MAGVNDILTGYSGNNVEKEYSKRRAWYKPARADVRKDQVAMLQVVINELKNDKNMPPEGKAAVLRCVVAELKEQLDPAGKHNKNSTLFKLVDEMGKNLGLSDNEKATLEDQRAFLAYHDKNLNLRNNKGCRDIFPKVTQAVKLAQVTEQATPKQLAAKTITAQLSKSDSQKLPFHTSFGNKGDVQKAFDRGGKKWFTSSERKDQIKFLEKVIAETNKIKGQTIGRGAAGDTHIRMDPTQAQILQGAVNFIREQLGKNPKGRLVNVLKEMEANIRSSISGTNIDLSPDRCKAALSKHVSDKPGIYIESNDGFSKKFNKDLTIISAHAKSALELPEKQAVMLPQAKQFHTPPPQVGGVAGQKPQTLTAAVPTPVRPLPQPPKLKPKG